MDRHGNIPTGLAGEEVTGWRERISASRKGRWIFLTLLIVLIAGLDVVAMHAVFTSQRSGSNDFYPRWRGTQLFFLEGIDPYSEEATHEIQRGIRGRLSRPDEDQLAFVYPFYTALLLLPLIPFSYDWVEAFWMVVVEISLLAGIIIYLKTLRWRLSPWLLALTALWSVLFYHSARTVLLGQFAGPIFLWTAALFWALSRRRDVTAGALLALTTVKPQMSILLIPALLWWAVGRRRWRFLAGSAGTMIGLSAISFLILPGWFSGFVSQVIRYPSYTTYGNPLLVITQYYLPQIDLTQGSEYVLTLALTLLLLGYLLWGWRRLPELGPDDARFHYVMGLTLIVTNIVVPRTATTNYVVLYLPLFFVFKQLAERRRRAEWWVAFFYMGSLVTLWFLFFETVQGDFEHPLMFLPLPLSLLMVFLASPGALKRRFNHRDDYPLEASPNVLPS